LAAHLGIGHRKLISLSEERLLHPFNFEKWM
jgi:hypothetical protein